MKRISVIQIADIGRSFSIYCLLCTFVAAEDRVAKRPVLFSLLQKVSYLYFVFSISLPNETLFISSNCL